MRKSLIILLGILLVASFLRFYQLGTNPPSLTWDETAWGYNAYALGTDGKDEFGKFLPITYLESFGDFKPPLYAYLDILPVKLLGLTEFSVRLPSAFFGVLTVLLTFFLVREIFYSSKRRDVLALTTAGILAISPWHIMLSRAAFEADVATFFIIGGVTTFLYALRKSPWFLILSAISFVFSMYTFNTARIVSPLLVVVLALGYIKVLLSHKKEVILAAVIGILLFAPLALFLRTPESKLRFQEVNIFTDSTVVERANRQIQNDHNAMYSKIIHNRRLGYTVQYIKHYFDNFSPVFLFIKGDGNPKFSIQDVGQMYLWEVPFFVAGILFLFRKKEGKWWMVPLWMILGVVPAATARETPHALRIESTLPTFQIFAAYGTVVAYDLLRETKAMQKNLKIFFIVAFAGVIFFNFLYFYNNYFAHYAKEFSGEWQYGYKESVEYVKSVQDKYKKVYVTEELGRPYIYYLTYLHYNPEKFRQEAKVEREVFGFVHVRSFGNYVFAKKLPNVPVAGPNLYIDVPGQVPGDAKVLKEFKLLNGSTALVAYTY